MLDRLLNSPALAIGFIVLVIYLAFVYFTNRTKAQLARMQGPRRFQPDWSHGKKPRRRRRPARSGSFSPDWGSRRDRREAEEDEDAGAPQTSEAPTRGPQDQS